MVTQMVGILFFSQCPHTRTHTHTRTLSFTRIGGVSATSTERKGSWLHSKACLQEYDLVLSSADEETVVLARNRTPTRVVVRGVCKR